MKISYDTESGKPDGLLEEARPGSLIFEELLGGKNKLSSLSLHDLLNLHRGALWDLDVLDIGHGRLIADVENELSGRELSREQSDLIKQSYGFGPIWREDFMKIGEGWMENHRERCETASLDELALIFKQVREFPDPVWLKTMEEALEKRFPELGLTLDGLRELCGSGKN